MARYFGVNWRGQDTIVSLFGDICDSIQDSSGCNFVIAFTDSLIVVLLGCKCMVLRYGGPRVQIRHIPCR